MTDDWRMLAAIRDQDEREQREATKRFERTTAVMSYGACDFEDLTTPAGRERNCAAHEYAHSVMQRHPEGVAADRDCVFCRIIRGEAPARYVHRWADAIAIIPLNPVVPGHILVIPRIHVVDALEYPDVTACTMYLAASVAVPPCNLITSVGTEATQSVRHLHIHVVPRAHRDGLPLTWTPQQEGQR